MPDIVCVEWYTKNTLSQVSRKFLLIMSINQSMPVQARLVKEREVGQLTNKHCFYTQIQTQFVVKCVSDKHSNTMCPVI